MNEIPSAEFRKVYARLRERTVVTVNGHVIGEWIPVNAPVMKMSWPTHRHITDEDVVYGPPEADAVLGGEVIGAQFTPFRPAPKPSQKRK